MDWKSRLSFLFLLICSCTVNGQVKNRIDALVGEIPYQVSLRLAEFKNIVNLDSKIDSFDLKNNILPKDFERDENYKFPHFCGGL